MADPSPARQRRRVLVLPKWYPWPDRPVFGLFCREHARAAALRNDVVVLAFRAEPMRGLRLFRLWEDSVEPVPTLRLVYRRPRLRPLAMATQLAGMAGALWRLRRRGWTPDLLHAHVFEAGFPAVVLGRLLRRPVVVSEHFTAFQRGLVRGYDRVLARIAFNGAAVVCPVSEDLRRQLEAVAPRARFVVVPNVADTALFHPAAGAKPRAAAVPARLLNVATIDAKKGHATLVDAVAVLREGGRELRVDIVGEGQLRGELERRIVGLGLDGAVRLLGPRAPVEVAALLRDADAFVLPSRFENLPVVLLEALASGVPAVASAVGGVPEVVDDAVGALVAPDRPSDLAAAIARVLDEHVRFDPRALARRAAERYSLQAVGAAWDAVYDDAGARRR